MQGQGQTSVLLTWFLLLLGWLGRVPLAFMLLTSLLKADMSESRLCGRLLGPPVSASSRCSAMKGVPLPFCGDGSLRTCGPELSFIPFISPSTSSSERTAPQVATDKRGQTLVSIIWRKNTKRESNTVFWNMKLLKATFCGQALTALPETSLVDCQRGKKRFQVYFGLVQQLQDVHFLSSLGLYWSKVLGGAMSRSCGWLESCIAKMKLMPEK